MNDGVIYGPFVHHWDIQLDLDLDLDQEEGEISFAKTKQLER